MIATVLNIPPPPDTSRLIAKISTEYNRLIAYHIGLKLWEICNGDLSAEEVQERGRMFWYSNEKSNLNGMV